MAALGNRVPLRVNSIDEAQGVLVDYGHIIVTPLERVDSGRFVAKTTKNGQRGAEALGTSAIDSLNRLVREVTRP